MSESETEMILAVMPQNDSIVKETLYERSGAKTCCSVEKNGETIQLQISGRTAELYVMLAGIHWKNTEAIVNGRTLTKVTAREGLYFTEGYLELEEGILVKINPSAEPVSSGSYRNEFHLLQSSDGNAHFLFYAKINVSQTKGFRFQISDLYVLFSPYCLSDFP